MIRPPSAGVARRFIVIRPRILHPGVPRVPVRAAAYSPGRLNGVFLAIAGGSTLLAFVRTPAWERPVWGVIAIGMVIFGVGVRGFMEAVDEGHVRTRASRGGILLAPTLLVSVSLWIGGALALLPLLTALLVWPPGAPLPSLLQWTRWAPAVGAGFGLFILGREILRLRTPRGLLLTPAGLTGIRGALHLDLAWDDVLGVGVVDANRAYLGIRTGSGLVKVEPYAIGSDPNVVAPIVRHYLNHPEDRHLLADPVAAIRRVEAAAAAQA